MVVLKDCRRLSQPSWLFEGTIQYNNYLLTQNTDTVVISRHTVLKIWKCLYDKSLRVLFSATSELLWINRIYRSLELHRAQQIDCSNCCRFVVDNNALNAQQYSKQVEFARSLVYSLTRYTHEECLNAIAKRYRLVAVIYILHPLTPLILRPHPQLSVLHNQILHTICEFCMKFSQLVLMKIFKFVATTCQMLRLKCTKLNLGWGYAPDPAGGAYSAPQTY